VYAGDNIEMAAEIISPIAMEEGLRFAIREGGRTVGAASSRRLSNKYPTTPKAPQPFCGASFDLSAA
jgi:hypothetical protein